MMSTSNYTRGRSLPRPPSQPSIDMDLNNLQTRTRTPSPVKRPTYLSNHNNISPGNSPPSVLSRSGSIYSHPPLSPSSLGDMKKLNRSSVQYLRNLSEFTRDDDTVIGLGIPEIET